MKENSKRQLLEELVNIQKNYDIKAYRKLTLKILAMGPHSSSERIALSDALFNLGMLTECLKVLGPERHEFELATIEPMELGIQLELGITLFHCGAHYIARRIIERVALNAKKRHLPMNGPLTPLLDYQVSLVNNMGDHPMIEKIAKQALQTYPQNSIHRLKCTLMLFTSCFWQGKYEEAQTALTQADGMVKQHGGGFETEIAIHRLVQAIHLGSSNNAKTQLDAIRPMMQNEQYPYRKAWFAGVEGEYWLTQSGQRDKALNCFQESLTRYTGEAFSLLESLRVLSDIHKFFPNAIAPHDKAVLFYAPFYSKYKIPPTHDHCITPQDFHQENYQGLQDNDLDLISGIFQLDGKKTFLSELQRVALIALVGSGRLGVDEVALADYVYREDPFDPKTTLEKCRKVISSLKDTGLEVRKEKKRLYFEFGNCHRILMPSIQRVCGVHNLVMHFCHQFTRAQLEKLLGISKATANRYLTEWLEKGLLQVLGKGKNCVYEFVIEDRSNLKLAA